MISVSVEEVYTVPQTSSSLPMGMMEILLWLIKHPHCNFKLKIVTISVDAYHKDIS